MTQKPFIPTKQKLISSFLIHRFSFFFDHRFFLYSRLMIVAVFAAKIINLRWKHHRTSSNHSTWFLREIFRRANLAKNIWAFLTQVDGIERQIHQIQQPSVAMTALNLPAPTYCWNLSNSKFMLLKSCYLF